MIYLHDTFAGTVIDTSKWTKIDTANRFTQNNALSISYLHNSTVSGSLTSVSSVSSGAAVAQAHLNWGTSTTQESFITVALIGSTYTASVSSRTNVGGKFRLMLYKAGGNYDYDTTVSKNTDVKLWTDGSTVKFYYWNGSSWAQMGSDVTASLGYPITMQISYYDTGSFTGTDPGTIQQAYYSTTEYTTHYPPYGIVSSVTGDGTISPLGETPVLEGGSQQFNISSGNGYYILDVLIDGVSAGQITSYTFTNVTSNHTINVTFVINTYMITTSVIGNGTVTPTSPSVDYGSSQTFTMLPGQNSHISKVLIDSVNMGPVSSYTFTNVTATHIITIYFQYIQEVNNNDVMMSPNVFVIELDK